MEGYLTCHLEGNLLSNKYYLILHEGTLIYCVKKGGQKLGQIHLSICQIRRKSVVSSRFDLQHELVLETGSSTMELRGTQLELDAWERVLTHVEQEEVVGGITDEIAKVKSVYSQFEEILKLLTQRIEGNSAFVGLADDLERNGGEFRSRVNEWLQLVDQATSDHIDSEFQSCVEWNIPQGIPKIARVEEISDLFVNQPNKESYLRESLAYVDFQYTSNQKRVSLPATRSTNLKPNHWSDLKSQLFKQHLYIPIYLQEPLSLVQRYCEGMQYASLLEQADQINDSGFRLSLVVGFFIGQLAHVWDRYYLPFRPVKFETFEYETPTFKFLAEQVTEEDSVFICSSDRFIVQAQISWQWQFTGAILMAEPQLHAQIQLLKNKDLISISLKDFCLQVHNLITQKPLVQLQGRVDFVNQTNGETAVLDFARLQGRLNHVTGSIRKENVARYVIEGEWNKSVTACQQLTSEEIVIFRKQHEIDYAKMTEFGLQLNHLHQWNIGKLPLTDSRFRADLRVLETGNYNLAEVERRRILSRQAIDQDPLWFTPLGDQQIHVSNGNYFKCKSMNGFSDNFQIF